MKPPLYSLSVTPPQPDDRRTGERHSAILRVGTLKVAGATSLCLLKNISAGGLMAKVYSPVGLGEDIRIGLKNQKEFAGKVAWSRDDHIGVAFAEPIDVQHALREDAKAAKGRKSRMPRIAVSLPVVLAQDGRRLPGRCLDLSQGGAKVQVSGVVRDGPLSLAIRDNQPIAGAVRWQEEDTVGVAFNELLPLPTLLEMAAAGPCQPAD